MWPREGLCQVGIEQEVTPLLFVVAVFSSHLSCAVGVVGLTCDHSFNLRHMPEAAGP